MPRGELRKEGIGYLRPVDELLISGHWEGGLIKGACIRSLIGTLVECTT